MRLLSVQIACNDPDSGLWRGRAAAIELVGRDGCSRLDLELVRGRDVAVAITDDGRLRVGRFLYPFDLHRRWVGNWCWDGFALRLDVAEQLVWNLHLSGRWSCAGGLADACDAWDDGLAGVVVAELLGGAS